MAPAYSRFVYANFLGAGVGRGRGGEGECSWKRGGGVEVKRHTVVMAWLAYIETEQERSKNLGAKSFRRD